MSATTSALTDRHRHLLEEQRGQIVAALAAADRDLAELRDLGSVADVEFSEEGGEGSSPALERSQVEALRAQMSARLRGVDEAMARIDAGSYGFCESCGGPIGEARLEALPDAAMCVVCKSSSLTAHR